jgi:dCMP deaminase
MNRQPLEQTMMELAHVWSQRATCPDLQVGCVIATKDGHVQASGYNGSPRGAPHCREISVAGNEGKVGPRCKDNYYEQNHRVVHAEANAVSEAARYGKALLGCVAYVTHAPCYKCAALLAQAGVDLVVVDGPLPDYMSWYLPGLEFVRLAD